MLVMTGGKIPMHIVRIGGGSIEISKFHNYSEQKILETDEIIKQGLTYQNLSSKKL